MKAVKLTLSIPGDLLEEVKEFSRKTRQPISRLVSRYFSHLSRLGVRKVEGGEISARVKNVTGLARTEKKDEEILWESLSQKFR